MVILCLLKDGRKLIDKTAIGDADDPAEGTILARLAALEAD